MPGLLSRDRRSGRRDGRYWFPPDIVRHIVLRRGHRGLDLGSTAVTTGMRSLRRHEDRMVDGGSVQPWGHQSGRVTWDRRHRGGLNHG
jgi:hypothetical protein